MRSNFGGFIAVVIFFKKLIGFAVFYHICKTVQIRLYKKQLLALQDISRTLLAKKKMFMLCSSISIVRILDDKSVDLN